MQISGGMVEATDSTGIAIQAAGDVEISGDATVVRGGSRAIETTNASSTVTVQGGTVEATAGNGTAIDAVGGCEA